MVKKGRSRRSLYDPSVDPSAASSASAAPSPTAGPPPTFVSALLPSMTAQASPRNARQLLESLSSLGDAAASNPLVTSQSEPTVPQDDSEDGAADHSRNEASATTKEWDAPPDVLEANDSEPTQAAPETTTSSPTSPQDRRGHSHETLRDDAEAHLNDEEEPIGASTSSTGAPCVMDDAKEEPSKETQDPALHDSEGGMQGETDEAAMLLATRLSVELANARADLDDWQTQALYWKEQYEDLERKQQQLLLQVQQQQGSAGGETSSEHSNVAAVPPGPPTTSASPKESQTGRRLGFWKLASPLRSTSKESSIDEPTGTSVHSTGAENKENDAELHDSQALQDDVYLELFSQKNASEDTETADPRVDEENLHRQLKQLQSENTSLLAQLHATQEQLRSMQSDAALTPSKSYDDEGPTILPSSISPQSAMDFGLQDDEQLPGRWASMSTTECEAN